ncbi:MAG TPA: J domain-containing protein [Acidimicrobiia bacterium]|nr:J domain-containing protein [Acidimicrobiia bacterium]
MASATVRRNDLYQVLGVAPSATAAEIADAFRAQARNLHPDRNPGDTDAVERFKVLTLAYQTLIRTPSRDAYDRRHLVGRASTTTPASPHRAPLFRTAGRARAAVWSGVLLFVLGVAVAATLAVVDTGGAAETVTLWIAAAKLLVCGPALAVAGALRLRHFATGQ